jgi:sulfate permease, SulP family
MRINLFGGLRPLSRASVLRDVFAGINLASINIPQVLGYARIAGTPLVTGLYTVLLPLLAFALFGSSRHLVVAADSATAAIFHGSLSRMAVAGSPHYLALAGAVALLTAAMLLIARVFKLGFLADFLSRTVLVGFLTGVGIQVSISMLSDMFGFESQSRYTLTRLWDLLRSLNDPDWPTIAYSAGVVALILAGKRWLPRWPLALLAVLGSITASYAYDLGEYHIALIGVVPRGLPQLAIPAVSWSEMLALVPVAGSCFVMIMAQSAATARGFAQRYHESEDSDADLLGLAAANLAAGLSGTFVVNGSPTQTAMADQVGARSQMAQVVLALLVVVVLLFLTAPLQYLPQCVLASIVFTIATGMVDVKHLRDIRRESPGEFALAVVTAAAVVAVGVEQGILIAIALSLFRHVRHSYRPHTMVLAPGADGRWTPEPATPGRVTEPGLILYRFGADLFYANQDRFVDEVRMLVARAPTPVHTLVVDAGAITDIDYSAALGLHQLLTDLAGQQVRVIFGRVSPYLRADMDRHGLTAVVGVQNLYPTLHEALAGAHATPVATADDV